MAGVEWAARVDVLEMEEKDYVIEGEKVISRKIPVPFMGGLHEVKFTQQQYIEFGRMNGQPAVLKGVVGISKTRVPVLELREVLPGKAA